MERPYTLIEIARHRVGLVRFSVVRVCEAIDMVEYAMVRPQVLLEMRRAAVVVVPTRTTHNISTTCAFEFCFVGYYRSYTGRMCFF